MDGGQRRGTQEFGDGGSCLQEALPPHMGRGLLGPALPTDAPNPNRLYKPRSDQAVGTELLTVTAEKPSTSPGRQEGGEQARPPLKGEGCFPGTPEGARQARQERMEAGSGPGMHAAQAGTDRALSHPFIEATLGASPAGTQPVNRDRVGVAGLCVGAPAGGGGRAGEDGGGEAGMEPEGPSQGWADPMGRAQGPRSPRSISLPGGRKPLLLRSLQLHPTQRAANYQRG